MASSVTLEPRPFGARPSSSVAKPSVPRFPYRVVQLRLRRPSLHVQGRRSVPAITVIPRRQPPACTVLEQPTRASLSRAGPLPAYTYVVTAVKVPRHKDVASMVTARLPVGRRRPASSAVTRQVEGAVPGIHLQGRP